MRRPTHTGARSSLFGAPEPSRGTSTQNDSHYGGAQMFAEQSEDTMEQDIFESTNQLRQGVSYIKDISIAIDNHLNEEQRFFNQVNSDMDRVQGGLDHAIAKVKHLMKYSTTSHMCIMFLFLMFVFFILYLMIRRSF